jgi:hypothetical protein
VACALRSHVLFVALLQLDEYSRVCDVLMSTYARPKNDPLRMLGSTQQIPASLLKLAAVLHSTASPHSMDFLQRLLRLAMQVSLFRITLFFSTRGRSPVDTDTHML